MHRGVLYVGLGLVAAAGVWSLLGGEPPRPGDERASAKKTPSVATRDAAPDRSRPADESAPRSRGRRAQRDAMRDRILAALESDKPAAKPAEPPAKGDDGARLPARSPSEEDPEIKAYLEDVLNNQLKTAVFDCLTLAREAGAELSGSLVLQVDMLSDKDIGGVIESVEPAKDNEVNSPELLECMRESVLSMTLPQPPEGRGRERFKLDIPTTKPGRRPAQDGSGQRPPERP